jgi:hypothetical protein
MMLLMKQNFYPSDPLAVNQRSAQYIAGHRQLESRFLHKRDYGSGHQQQPGYQLAKPGGIPIEGLGTPS